MLGGILMKKTVSFFIIFIFAFTSSIQALSWAYPFVVWDGNVYEVKQEKLVEKEIGEWIGEVKTRPNDMTGEYYGNASNAYPKGTPYYEINNIPTEKAIAVKVSENRWQKAIYSHEAPFHWLDLLKIIIPIIIFISIAILIRFRIKNNRNG